MIRLNKTIFKRILGSISDGTLGINIDDKMWIGGYRIEAYPTIENDKKLLAYIQYKGFINLINTLKRSKIPFYLVYSSIDKTNNFFLLTKANNVEKLRKNLIIIESILKAIYPSYDLHPLTGKDIKNIYNWKEVSSNGDTPPLFIIAPDIRQTHKPRNIFKLPIIHQNGENGIKIGKLIDTDELYKIDIQDLKRHLTCLGSTGMGKTTTVASILNQIPKNINYLVIDFHNEYGKILNNYDMIIRPGKDDIALNPLKKFMSLDYDENISMISEIFSEIYGFTHPQAYYFKLVLEATYSSYKMAGENSPNIMALLRILDKYPTKSGSEHETKMALLRRLKQLVEGQARKIFYGDKEIRIDDLFDKNIIIEVGHIREVTIRKIYAYFILKMIYEYQLSLGEKDFNHITVLEEARYLLPPRRDYDPPNIAEKIVNEIRKFGESIFIITQFPSQISKDIIKNSGILIIHRLSGVEDIRIITNIISLTNDQIDYIKQIDVGEAIIRDIRNPLPFPVKIIPHTANT